MAAPSQHEVDKTDLTSEDFDPVLALNEQLQVELPFPNIRPFNNLAEYESFVTGKSIKCKHGDLSSADASKASAKVKPISEKDAQEASTSSAIWPSPRFQEASLSAKPRKIYHNVLTKMEKSYASGPLGVLYKCVQERIKVKVWTRNYTEIRGICTGYILAFDKHWNMAMADVDEVYLKPRKSKTPVYGQESAVGTNEETTSARTNPLLNTPKQDQMCLQRDSNAQSHPRKDRRWRTRKYDTCHRHLGQLFIRGDNVVIVALVHLG